MCMYNLNPYCGRSYLAFFLFFFQALKIKYPNQLDQKIIEKQLPGKQHKAVFPSIIIPLNRWPRFESAGNKIVHTGRCGL